MRAKRYPEGASTMLRALGALRSGLISFNEFERRTREDWTRIAKALHGKWSLPPSVSVEDVRQELLLAIIVRKESSQNRNLLEKWSPKARRTRKGVRRTGLDEYVVWNAKIQAARWIHAQRGAKRNRENGDVAGKIKSTFLPVLSSVERVSDRSDTVRMDVPVEAIQEQALILEEGLQRAKLSSLKRTRDVATALLAGREEISRTIEKRSEGLRKPATGGMVRGMTTKQNGETRETWAS